MVFEQSESEIPTSRDSPATTKPPVTPIIPRQKPTARKIPRKTPRNPAPKDLPLKPMTQAPPPPKTLFAKKWRKMVDGKFSYF